MPQWLTQLFSYCLVGGLNTAVSVALMALGHALGWGYTAYTLLGYGVAMALSFVLNFVFTFKAKGHKARRMRLFFAVNLLNLAMVQALQYLLIDMSHLPHLPAIGMAMGAYTLAGFYLNRTYVFGPFNQTGKTA
ncbi:MAG TPA: GtrA family protein [Alphaproteobacteria bacterium]|nr:GtrA family protein [Alphaproteobacteria bacterium]